MSCPLTKAWTFLRCSLRTFFRPAGCTTNLAELIAAVFVCWVTIPWFLIDQSFLCRFLYISVIWCLSFVSNQKGCNTSVICVLQ